MEYNNTYAFQRGLGSAQKGTMLAQAIPDRMKTKKWRHGNMDVLESIGITQMSSNLEFRDYYKMIEGRLVYSDYEQPPEITREIAAIRSEANIPTFLKHYDILGLMVNAIVGEYLEHRDKFRVDSTDDISQNEYLREKSRLVQAYTKEQLGVELEKILIENGIDPNKQDFQSEEEKAEYLQMLDAKKTEMTPPEIQLHMSKNWRTKAAEWGENTLEADAIRFSMDSLDREEAVDFLLTGRVFRHYRVGYDYYKPENWSPIETFFSQELAIKNPQDGEYVGRVTFKSPSAIIDEYGSKLTALQIQRLSGYYDIKTPDYATEGGSPSYKNLIESNFAETHIVPHEDYYNYQMNLELESALGAPMATRQIKDDNGEDIEVPAWLPHTFGNNSIPSRFASAMRDDIDVRKDSLQVTEAYWRSYKRIGLLTYRNKRGILTQDIVTDELLADFLSENNIKKVNTKTLEEIEESPEENTIAYQYITEIWKGVKINRGNSYLREDIYLDVKPLEYQIKGDSNIYDLKLPVSGIIDSPVSKKIMPYQISHNIVMNQAYNLLEKEIGMFFLLDINFLPSEYKELGNTEDMLINIRNMAKDIGLLPTDMSKQNLGIGTQPMNSFQVQDLTFGNQIQTKLMLAQNYKMMALEQIGITPQRLGTPNKYETAEGIKQGMDASYTQTASIFDKLETAKKRTLELHLSVAQYAQKNNKDITVFYSKSDGDKVYLKFTDENFHLRNLMILPTTNGKKRKEFEQLRQILMNNNTIGGDILDYAELVGTDTITELISISRKSRIEKQKEVQAQRDHEQGLLDKQLQAQDARDDKNFAREEASKERDRETALEKERIESLGDALRGGSEGVDLDIINKAADRAIKSQQIEQTQAFKEVQETNKTEVNEKKYELELEKIRLKELEIKERAKERANNKYIARVNKN